MPTGNLQEMLSQGILAGIILVGRLGVDVDQHPRCGRSLAGIGDEMAESHTQTYLT